MSTEEVIEQPSSQSDAGSERSFVHAILHRVQARSFDRESATTRVIVLLAACAAIDVTSRFATVYFDFPGLYRDLVGLLALLVLGGTTLFVFSIVHSNRIVRVTMLTGVGILVLAQISDVTDEFEFAQSNVFLAKTSATHLALEYMALVVGGIVLIAGCFFALFEGEAALRRLAVERERLSKSVNRRRAAEHELQEARQALEQEVVNRTEELEERNEQLRIELAERKRAEASLEMRLRYEEGLAACSHTLLADTEPTEALTRALHLLLKASEACRVYIFENVDAGGRGLCARLIHEAWDSEKCPWCEPTPDLELIYDEGLDRWRQRLIRGQAVAGLAEDLPGSEAQIVKRFRAKSILLLPVGWQGHWRGFIGFDDTAHERLWSPEEISILRTAAKMVGVCIDRHRSEEALRRAHEQLERRVDERTADLQHANERLQEEIAERARAEAANRELEVQLRQAQKMQAIGTLAGGIAHDFNNILASILGYAELGIQKSDPESRLNRYLEEVLKAGNRAKELVRQILLFSRQAEEERVPVQLQLIAREVLELVKTSCPPHITIESDIVRSDDAVLADPIQMHQVILNLCTNALHAMGKETGRLHLAVGPVRLRNALQTPTGYLRPGEYIRVGVTDTGHGIDGSTLERIFEPFFTTKNVGEGTGMGLAIVHGIVTRLSGVVAVKSSPGQGSLFEVYLPAYQHEETETASAESGPHEGSERILVVDDEPQLVSLWSEMLGQLGYEVTAFCDSEEALQSYKTQPEAFDLVLLDQTMPNMTGLELAENILQIRPELPIIMATGFSEAATAERSQELGIAEFVYKPILGNDLGQAIRRALDAFAENGKRSTDEAPAETQS